jgi:hypothetical protein
MLFKTRTTTENLDLRIYYEAAMIIKAMGKDNFSSEYSVPSKLTEQGTQVR